MFSVRIGGLSRPLQSFKVQRLGALYPIRTAKVQTSGTLRLVYQASSSLTASPSPSSPHGRGTHSPVVTSCTITPGGGLGPYTYSWSLVSYDASTPPTISNPSFATTSFSQDGMTPSDDNFATFACVVTDSLGATATVSVDVTFIYLDGSLL